MEQLKQYDNIPAEMRELDNWLLWRLEDVEGRSKPNKTPYSAHGGMGKVNDPKTWANFDKVIKTFQTGSYSGIGFVFTKTPFIGVDIDGGIDPDTGEMLEGVTDIIERLDSYTELSQSGKGFHIVVKGKLPPGNRKSKDKHYEMYGETSPRYFAITGNVFGSSKPIRACQEDIDAVHKQYIQRDHDQGSDQMIISTEIMKSRSSDSAGLDDGVLIARMSRSKNGDLFNALWAGDTSRYDGDDSAADMALCNILAFNTG